MSLFTTGRPEDIDLAVPPLVEGKPSGQNIKQIAAGYSKYVPDWARAVNVEYRSGASGPSVSRIVEGGNIYTRGVNPKWPVLIVGKTGAAIKVNPTDAELIAARWAVSAGPWLIEDGETSDIPYQIAVCGFSGLAEGTLRERAAVGIREDGTLIHYANMSATLLQMQAAMLSRGCHDAIALDGGGSVCVIDSKGNALLGSAARQVCCTMVFRKIVEEQPEPAEPEFPGLIDPYLIFVQSLMPRLVTDAVVLHHAEAQSCTVQDVHGWHLANGWAGIGYHYFVSKLGEVFKGRPVDSMGAHTQDHNGHTVGVCAEGNFEKDEMSKAQRQAIVALVKRLLALYPGAEVKRHCDFNATLCPGKNYPFNEILAAVAGNAPAWDPVAEIAALAKTGLAGTDHQPDDKVTWGELAAIVNRVLEKTKAI
jgi:hypothetical protein